MKCINCYNNIKDNLMYCPLCGCKQPDDREAYEIAHPELARAKPKHIERTDEEEELSQEQIDEMIRKAEAEAKAKAEAEAKAKAEAEAKAKAEAEAEAEAKAKAEAQAKSKAKTKAKPQSNAEASILAQVKDIVNARNTALQSGGAQNAQASQLSRFQLLQALPDDDNKEMLIKMIDEGIIAYDIQDDSTTRTWYAICANLINQREGFYSFLTSCLNQRYEKARDLLLYQAYSELQETSAGSEPSGQPQPQQAFDEQSFNQATTGESPQQEETQYLGNEWQEQEDETDGEQQQDIKHNINTKMWGGAIAAAIVFAYVASFGLLGETTIVVTSTVLIIGSLANLILLISDINTDVKTYDEILALHHSSFTTQGVLTIMAAFTVTALFCIGFNDPDYYWIEHNPVFWLFTLLFFAGAVVLFFKAAPIQKDIEVVNKDKHLLTAAAALIIIISIAILWGAYGGAAYIYF